MRLLKLARPSFPRVLAVGVGFGLVALAATAPLRSSAFGEPTILKPQRLVPVSIDAGGSSLATIAAWHRMLRVAPQVDEMMLGRPGPRTEARMEPRESPAAAES